MRPIKSWGVELEGGFYGPYERAADDLGWDVTWDESVDTYAENAELVSPVYEKLTDLKTDLRELYGYMEDANGSMGFHIHIAVPRAVYYLLSSWGYVRFFQDEVVRRFPETQRRLSNHFCQEWVQSDQPNAYGRMRDWPANHTLQVQARDKYDSNGNERYRSINFCHGLHGTIEFRLFPASDWEGPAFKYLDFVEWSVAEWVRHNTLGLITESAEIAPEDVGDALIDLDNEPYEAPPEEDIAGALNLTADYFDRVFRDTFDRVFGPESGNHIGPEGWTYAEIEHRLVYPHAPGCAACDRVRVENEPELLRLHNPQPGARLNVTGTHRWDDE